MSASEDLQSQDCMVEHKNFHDDMKASMIYYQ